MPGAKANAMRLVYVYLLRPPKARRGHSGEHKRPGESAVGLVSNKMSPRSFTLITSQALIS